MDSDVPSVKIDTAVPVSARIWNYWLGGKDYYPVGKEAGDQFAQLYPGIFDEAPFDPPKNLTNLGGVARKPLSTSPAGSVHEPV
jgi:hypothetical protein